jgi:RimJ/RimL family protein N-acetyltransferase
MADAELLWRWANDAEARRWSFHSAPIPWETHVAWLAARLADPATRIFVAEVHSTPRAVVRFEKDDAEVAVVSILVDPDARGRGVGTRALRLSCRTAAREFGLERVDAYIKPANTASVAAFERAGFALFPDSARADALRMVWHPERRP